MRHVFLSLLSLSLLSAAVITVNAPIAQAAGKKVDIPKQEWPHSGPFGTYDKAALQRGFQVYREVCAACHGMKRIYFRNLSALGYSEDQIKVIASEYEVQDGPNDEGEMFMRPAHASDRIPSPYANEEQARFVNGGAYPPDMSLIAKARKGGADYLYALLTGYVEAPEGQECGPGLHYNKYFPGGCIAMAQPIMDGMVTYASGESASVSQASRDISQFLAWAAEPEMEERKRLGVQVILFLVVFAGIMYLTKRRVWSNLKDH